jgi:hypothetical protein
MPVQSLPASSSSAFWRIWDKTWWVFALLFLAANAWGWNRFGPFAVLRFWAAFFALSGAGIIWYGLRARRHARESLHWLPVQAVVVSSEVVRDVQRSFSDEAYDPARSMVYYYPEIEYEYEVEGRKYRSNRLIAVRVNWPKSQAEAWVAKYPAGAVVTARRHPEKPALAVLQPGMEGFEGRYRIPFFVGGAFLAAGAAGWVFFSRFD